MKRAFLSRGFTLIELLVVIAIISILSMVAFASFNEARKKGRDAARITDIQQIEAALKVFAATYGRYPSTEDGVCAYNNSFSANGCMQALVEAELFITLPTDPINSVSGGSWVNDYVYFYDNLCRSTGSSDEQYRLWANGERDYDATEQLWWFDNIIGATNCADPRN